LFSSPLVIPEPSPPHLINNSPGSRIDLSFSKDKYMSRLIIKNLPSYVDSARLREHFEQKKGPGGTITDVKVALKADGTSRRFGFLGYVSEKQAKAARDWFDKTFLGSSRISVDVVDVCVSFAGFSWVRVMMCFCVFFFFRDSRMLLHRVRTSDHVSRSNHAKPRPSQSRNLGLWWKALKATSRKRNVTTSLMSICR